MTSVICYACTNAWASGRKDAGPSLSRFMFQSWKDACIRESTDRPLRSWWGNPTWYKCLERLVLAKPWDLARSTRTVMSHRQAAHLNKYGMVSSVKTSACDSEINRLFNHCIHSHGQDQATRGPNIWSFFLKQVFFSTQKLLSVCRRSIFVS